MIERPPWHAAVHKGAFGDGNLMMEDSSHDGTRFLNDHERRDDATV